VWRHRGSSLAHFSPAGTAAWGFFVRRSRVYHRANASASLEAPHFSPPGSPPRRAFSCTRL
jgi:hypothetical protein